MAGGIRVESDPPGGKTRVFIDGEIDLATSPRLGRVLTALVDDSVGDVVVDLSGVEFLAVAGVRVFDTVGQRLLEAGRQLVLTGLQPPVARMLGSCARLFGPPAWTMHQTPNASAAPPAAGPPRAAAPLIEQAVVSVIRAPQRAAAVRRLVPLYRPPSLAFDRLTRLAADLLSAPVALLTLIEPDRQFFVSSYGLPEALQAARQSTLEYSICQYVVAAGRPLILNDTSRDPRLGGHLAVTELGVAAYAGIPLITTDGHAAGALAVLDFVARDWTDDKLAILANLAVIAMDEIRLAGLTAARG